MTTDEIVTRIRPGVDELRWMEVPWRSTLSQARQDASQIGRPLFVWAMNGDPLGCV